ncbi:MAG: tandem-95 repeat protein [Parasynechococcus sp.]|uniref:tandem-95 repeat protein n=1 Tax=Parasynechococcus sp. TaxID=3101203 RepID=UPI003886AD72
MPVSILREPPAVLINETWFDQATDQERVITLLQEIGHAVDDQLHSSSWDTVGDEGAYFARVILASQSEDVVKEWFNYDDHYILNIDGQAVAVEASNSNNAPTATYTTNHTVDEGGSVLVGVLTAIDPDLGASITYSLVGEDVPGFEITNGSGNSSSVSNARLPLRSTLQSGELFLGGDFIELGISDVGSFGTSGAKPSDFYGTIDSSDRIGLSNDADGFGTGDDLRIDFFLPGTPEERWSIGWGGNAKGSFSALVDNYNIGSLSNTSLINTSTSAQLSGSFAGTVDNTAEVSQTHSFDPTKQFFKTSVTITNVASGALADVLFMRSFDPDNTVYKGGSYVTTNKIEKTFAAGDGAAMVSATSSDDSYSDAYGSNSTVFFFSNDSRARVYTGGFSNRNPYDYRAGDDKNKTETADEAIGIVFDIGGLDAGESKTFDYFTSLTTIDESSSILNEISNGGWSFDPAHSAYDYLSDDNDEIVPITYRVTDEHGLYDDETFNITVSGVNDAPALVVDSTTSFTEDASGNQVGSVVSTFTASDLEGDDLTITLSDTTNYSLSSLETFDSLPTGWTNAKLDNSASLGSFLGRYKSSETISTDLFLSGQATTFGFDFYAIDSWDDERLNVYSGDTLLFQTQPLRHNRTETQVVNGTSTIEGEGTYTYSITPIGDRSELYKDSTDNIVWTDQKFAISITTPAGMESFSLKIGSTLNDGRIYDESWGIDNFYTPTSTANRVLLSADGLALLNHGSLPAFTLQASDGSLTSPAVTVSPSVTAVDDAAVISGDTAGSGAEDSTITGTLSATDDEGLTDNTYFSIESGDNPANGTASIDAETGDWSYEPTTNFNGSDSFTVTVTDDLGGTTTQAVSLTITPVDDPAVISGDTSGSGAEDTTITGALSAVDVEGLTDNTYFSIESGDNPSNGTASIDAETGAWSYEPNTNYNGSDSFTVTVTDDLGGITTQLVSLSISPVNDPPVSSGGLTNTQANEAGISSDGSAAGRSECHRLCGVR